MLGSPATVLRGYRIAPDQEIRALRMLRSVLHGSATPEVAGDLRIGTDVDESFTWIVGFGDLGLKASPDRRAERSTRPRGESADLEFLESIS